MSSTFTASMITDWPQGVTWREAFPGASCDVWEPKRCFSQSSRQHITQTSSLVFGVYGNYGFLWLKTGFSVNERPDRVEISAFPPRCKRVLIKDDISVIRSLPVWWSLEILSECENGLGLVKSNLALSTSFCSNEIQTCNLAWKKINKNNVNTWMPIGRIKTLYIICDADSEGRKCCDMQIAFKCHYGNACQQNAVRTAGSLIWYLTPLFSPLLTTPTWWPPENHFRLLVSARRNQ